MRKVIRYRLEVDYLSRDYYDRACQTSSPIYTKQEGVKQYLKAIQNRCIDNPDVPARCHLWKYCGWHDDNNPRMLTIMKNY